MTQITVNAINEYKSEVMGKGRDAYNRFSRKLHTGCAMGVITKEELEEIKAETKRISKEHLHNEIRKDMQILAEIM